MRTRLGVEVLGEQRRAADQLLHVRILAVEHAQRIADQAAPAVVIELRGVRLEVLDELRTIDAAAVGRAEGVQMQRQSLDPQAAPEPRAHRDQLRVDIGTGAADRLDIHLPELTVAAGLGRLVPEHRAEAPQLVALSAQHAVGDERAHDPRRRLRPQRQAVTAAVGERIHLLADDVRVLTDRALEQLGVLHQRYPDLLVAVVGEQRARAALEMLPGADCLRQHVVHSADRLDLCTHVSPRARAAALPPRRGRRHRSAGAHCRRGAPACWR